LREPKNFKEAAWLTVKRGKNGENQINLHDESIFDRHQSPKKKIQI
jgi:hypothetical protein